MFCRILQTPSLENRFPFHCVYSLAPVFSYFLSLLQLLFHLQFKSHGDVFPCEVTPGWKRRRWDTMLRFTIRHHFQLKLDISTGCYFRFKLNFSNWKWRFPSMSSLLVESWDFLAGSHFSPFWGHFWLKAMTLKLAVTIPLYEPTSGWKLWLWNWKCCFPCMNALLVGSRDFEIKVTSSALVSLPV